MKKVSIVLFTSLLFSCSNSNTENLLPPDSENISNIQSSKNGLFSDTYKLDTYYHSITIDGKEKTQMFSDIISTRGLFTDKQKYLYIKLKMPNSTIDVDNNSIFVSKDGKVYINLTDYELSTKKDPKTGYSVKRNYSYNDILTCYEIGSLKNKDLIKKNVSAILEFKYNENLAFTNPYGTLLITSTTDIKPFNKKRSDFVSF
ncbi:MAG: hypothetical protein AABZ74_15805 [Cyanobacteriota bacterium]